MKEKAKLVSLNGHELKTEQEPIPTETVQKHVKLPPNKILVRVLRKKQPSVLTVDHSAYEYEDFFPIVAKAETITMFNVGEFVALKAGKWEIIKLWGQEFMICDTYMIDFVVSAEYAATAEQYKDTSLSISAQAEAAKREAMSSLTPRSEAEALPPVIKGAWKNKSKPN